MTDLITIFRFAAMLRRQGAGFFESFSQAADTMWRSHWSPQQRPKPKRHL